MNSSLKTKSNTKNKESDETSRSSFFGIGKFSVTSGVRYSLIIGDDGAILTYIEGDTVKSRNFIASASPDNLAEFESVLSKNIAAPLFLIIDSMDQSFIQQSLPPISPIGVNKLIKRRLERNLGKDVIKGYVLLEREKTGRRDWNFLMVSLEKSPQLSVWLDFIESINNRLAGVYLLSVEAENIIKTIDAGMGLTRKKSIKGGKPQEFSKWKFFITNNKVGGFRQVVLRDGRIIFTRLGQSIGDETPEVVAGNIEQEMSSTIEYMKRLSFNPQDGLDIYIIASAGINAVIDTSKMQVKNVYKFTPFEAAGFLGIKGAAKPTDQFGDVVLSAAIACNRKHRLTLDVPQAVKVNNLYNIMVYQRVIATLSVLALLGYGGMQGVGAWQKYLVIEDLIHKKTVQQKKLDDLTAEINKGGIDVKKINETVSLYQQIISENTTALPLLGAVRAAIIPSVSIREITWGLNSNATPANPAPAAAASSGDKDDNVSLVLRFPEVASTDEEFSAIARKVLKDVRAAFPDYKAVYTKLPEVLSKKNEGGKIGFELEGGPVKIGKEQLEATLLLSKGSKPLPPSGPPVAGQPPSTDELIGLSKEAGK